MSEETINGLSLIPENAGTNNDEANLVSRMDKYDWILLCVSALSSFIYAFGHVFMGYYLPGIGLMATHWAVMLTVLICAARKGCLKFRHNGYGLYLLTLSLLLSACYGVYSENRLRWMNLPVLTVMTCQAIALSTGKSSRSSLPGVWEELCRVVPGLFRYWPILFKVFAGRIKPRKGAVAEVMIGVVVAIPVLTIAMLLLTSADKVFESVLSGGLNSMLTTDGSGLIKLFFAMILTFMLFSLLYGVLRPSCQNMHCAVKDSAFPELTASVTVILLDLVYVAFAVVQVRYLFMGAKSVHMAGGYAAYARSGFFQLVAVALLTLLLIGYMLKKYGSSRRIRVLCGLTAALTVVIDFSAFFRMRLYIGAYGLSLLRVLTLWAMAMILLCLLAVAIKACRPDIVVYPALMAVILGTWVCLNLANVDRIVAENQVARYNAGKTEWETINSLIMEQSPDAIPAYDHLADDEAKQRAYGKICFAFHPDSKESIIPSAYDWALTWLYVPESYE